MIENLPGVGVRAASVLLLPILVAACAPAAEPADPQRWIEEGDERDLAATLTDAYADLLAQEGTSASGDTLRPAAWERVGSDGGIEVRGDGAEAVLELQARGGAIVATTEHAATEGDHLRLQLRSADSGQLVVSWTTESMRAFDPERRIVLPLRASEVMEDKLVALGTHPGWTGEITRIRLRISNSVRTLDLGVCQLLTPPGPFDRLHGNLDGTVGKAVLQEEARLGILAAAGRSHLWGVQGSETARLRFGYGPLGAGIVPPGGALRFTVSAIRDDERELLFEDDIDLGRPPEWREADVALGRGGSMDLDFRITWASDAPGGEDRYPSPLGVWTNPRVVDTSSRPRRPNVFLFALDTVRADRLASYGYDSSPMPRLAEFAAGAMVFEDASANAPWSLASYASLFTSLYPSNIGVVESSNALPAVGPATLADLFRQAGYRTLAVTGGGYAGRHYGMDRGFERFWEGGDSAELTARLESWVDSDPEIPALVYVHSYEAHDYFRATPRYMEAASQVVGRRPNPVDNVRQEFIEKTARDLTPAEIQEIELLYLGGLRIMDEWFGRWLSLLEDHGQVQDSIIAVVSDHGEGFGEHGRVHHGNGVFQELVAVPFILKLPEDLGIDASTITEPISLLDVAPTLLELAGLVPPAGIQGRSLVPQLLEETVDGGRSAATFLLEAHLVDDFAIRVGRWKYIYRGDPSACTRRAGAKRYCERVHDLSEDPHESRDEPRGRTRLGELRRRFLDTILRETPGLRAIVRGSGRGESLEVGVTSPGEAARAPSRIWYPESGDLVSDASAAAQLALHEDDLDVVSWDRLPEDGLDGLRLWLRADEAVTLSLGPGCSDPVEPPVDLSMLEESVPTESTIRFMEATSEVPAICLVYTPPRATEQEMVASPEALERLRALGYVR